MASLIEVNRLTKLYGLVIGINDITLHLEPGVHGLLGPNGAGKSTLLKIITGQLKQTAGTIAVLGKGPYKSTSLYQQIGYCPEQDALYDFMTGLEFVEFLVRLRGYDRFKARELAEKALIEVGMDQFMHRRISTYSKGMRQRAKLAQSIAHSPELLILDEPFTGTDPIGRKHMIDYLRAYAQQGKSILIASHILYEIEQVAPNFILIYQGRVLASGNVHEIRGLMDQFPHRIKIRCDRLTDLAQALVAYVPISGLELEKGTMSLIALTHEPGIFYDKLPKIVESVGVKIYELSSRDDNLESVFHYLMEAQ